MDKKLSKNEQEKVDESFEMKILKRNPTENERKTMRRKISGRKGQRPYRHARSLYACIESVNWWATL